MWTHGVKDNMLASPTNLFSPYIKSQHLCDDKLPHSPRLCILNEGGSHKKSQVEPPKVKIVLGWVTYPSSST